MELLLYGLDWGFAIAYAYVAYTRIEAIIYRKTRFYNRFLLPLNTIIPTKKHYLTILPSYHLTILPSYYVS